MNKTQKYSFQHLNYNIARLVYQLGKAGIPLVNCLLLYLHHQSTTETKACPAIQDMYCLYCASCISTCSLIKSPQTNTQTHTERLVGDWLCSSDLKSLPRVVQCASLLGRRRIVGLNVDPTSIPTVVLCDELKRTDTRYCVIQIDHIGQRSNYCIIIA